MTNREKQQTKELKTDAVQEYQQMVKEIKPKPTILKNCFWAFLTGGLICTIGQGLFNWFTYRGMTSSDASAFVSTVLVFSAAVLTGLGIYDDLGKYGGAGTIVPITGFANAMVAPALEYQQEGMIFGVAARLFSIAGPVIVFGLVISWLIGLTVIVLS